MKKWFILLTMLLVSLSIFGSIQAQPEAVAQATITAHILNVRSGPGTSYSVITRINRGETYPIVGRNSNSSWWQIDIDNTSGWVYARYTSAVNPANAPVIETVACRQHIAPQCPDAQIFRQVSMQSFQNGIMIWRNDVPEVLVLFNDGRFLNYYDTWNGQSLAQETPPSGLFQPQFGFGLVWQNHPEVREGLGWATSSEDYYTTPIEIVTGATASAQTYYLRLLNARVVALNYYADSWSYLS